MTLIITQNTHVKVQKKKQRQNLFFVFFKVKRILLPCIDNGKTKKKQLLSSSPIIFLILGANKIFTVKGIVKSRKIFLSIVLNFLTLEVKHYFYCVKE